MTDFQSLGLSETLLRAVKSEGYTPPTPQSRVGMESTRAKDRNSILGVALDQFVHIPFFIKNPPPFLEGCWTKLGSQIDPESTKN